MQIIVVGRGKLATELLESLNLDFPCRIISWSEKGPTDGKTVIVHAGSGRELDEVISYCEETHSTLVELSTGSRMRNAGMGFPVVLCPNTNILMLKFMSMLVTSGHLFSRYRVKLTESHQAQKTSLPGTAVTMAHALGLKASDVRSVRDPDEQRSVLQISAEHLDRHAFHQVVIEDAVCRITIETRVQGASPYADGVGQILSAIRSNDLEDRLYEINEFVEKGWV